MKYWHIVALHGEYIRKARLEWVEKAISMLENERDELCYRANAVRPYNALCKRGLVGAGHVFHQPATKKAPLSISRA